MDIVIDYCSHIIPLPFSNPNFGSINILLFGKILCNELLKIKFLLGFFFGVFVYMLVFETRFLCVPLTILELIL